MRSLLTFATIATLALPGFAQAPTPPASAAAASSPIIDKFAVFVPQRVIDQSGHCRKMFSALEMQGKQWQDKLQAKSVEGQGIQKQLQATGLSDAGKEALEKQLRDLEYDFNKMQEDAKADMEKAKQKAGNQFNQDVGPIVEAMAKEKGLQAIIQYSPGFFAYLDEAAAISFSDEIARRVDAKFGDSAPVEPAAPAAHKAGGKK